METTLKPGDKHGFPGLLIILEYLPKTSARATLSGGSCKCKTIAGKVFAGTNCVMALTEEGYVLQKTINPDTIAGAVQWAI